MEFLFGAIRFRIQKQLGLRNLRLAPRLLLDRGGQFHPPQLSRIREFIHGPNTEMFQELIRRSIKQRPTRKIRPALNLDQRGVEQLLNRRGTTWRKLPPEVQGEAANAEGAVRLMLEHPSAIRRPVVEAGDQLWTGFDAEDYRRRLEA